MPSTIQLQIVPCPVCGEMKHAHWATESGFHVVRCHSCRFIYLNPRPCDEIRNQATQLGAHAALEGSDMTERHSPSKIQRYERLFKRILGDVWAARRPIRWLDVGAGYGEVVEAVTRLAPPGSMVQGLEPMIPKVDFAKKRGITLRPEFLGPEVGKFDFVSSINVLSHVNDPRDFIRQLSAALAPGGDLVIETGDMGDVQDRSQFPGILDLPDHVGFATRDNVVSMCEDVGLRIIGTEQLRIDGFSFLAKSVVKRMIGRSSMIAVPYRSPYRRLIVRARLDR